MKTIVQNQMRYFHDFNIDTPQVNTINLELTNVCDLRCKMCRRGSRPQGFMEISLAKDILAEAKDLGVKQIGLHTVGESILHSQIGEIIRLCKEHGFYTYVDVNGNTLTEDKANQLVDSGLDSIKFSIDAADDETYARIRKGGNFSTVYKNIQNLRRIRDEKQSPMRIFCLFIIMQDNQHQREKFKTKMADAVDEIQYTVINQAAGRMDTGNYLESSISDFCIPNSSGVCANPFTRMVITWQGDVSMCCIDFDLNMKIGTFEKGKLATIWNGDAARTIRKNMQTKNYSNLPTICRDCDNLKYDAALRSKMINNMYR